MADRFETTRWSLVLAAGGDAEGSREALEWLCATYWYPLYAFVRRQGNDVETARDLTQAFFLQLLDRASLRQLDPREGRFRAFLIAALRHFLSNERTREHAAKRRMDDPALRVSLDEVEERYLREPIDSLSPEALYEARWATSVLDRALRRLEEEQEASGKGEAYQRLRGHLTGDETPYDKLAAELGTTEGALRVSVHRLRRRLGVLLRGEVAQTVSDPADIDGEIQHLLAALRRAA